MNPFKRLFLKITSKIVKDPSILIKGEILVKLKYARIKGWVGGVAKEIKFISDKKFEKLNSVILKSLGVYYKQDIIKSRKKEIQWDHQFDSITTFKRGGGDCNSINRVIQVYNHTKGITAYLVTYVTKKFKDNHTTCILHTDKGYIDCDYGDTHSKEPFKTLKEAVYYIAGNSVVVSYVVQDINWKFVTV